MRDKARDAQEAEKEREQAGGGGYLCGDSYLVVWGLAV